MGLKRLLHRIFNMCDEAWGALLGTLLVCCTMAFCAFLILVEIGTPTLRTYDLFQTAQALAEAPAALILLAGIGTVCLEEQALRQK